MSKERTKVGHVKELHRFAVKSMRGEHIQSAKLGWRGLQDDRRFAIVLDGETSGFPWLTPRLWPEIILYHAYIVMPEGGGEAAVRVRTPAGQDLAIDSKELIEEIIARSGRPCHVLHHFGGFFDCSDVSIITTATLKALTKLTGRELDARRFRPNIVIEAVDDKEFPEDKWVGDVLVFGETGDLARVRVNRKDQRCMVVNLDPDSAKQDPQVLKEIVGSRKNLVGVYGSTQRPGNIRVGDPVWLQRG